MEEFLNQQIDTVCGNADQACPMFSGQVNRFRWGFPCHRRGQKVLAEFRRVRDEIKPRFRSLRSWPAPRADALIVFPFRSRTLSNDRVHEIIVAVAIQLSR